MAEQCRAKHPTIGVRCERHQEHNHKPTAAERGTHRAELPEETDPRAAALGGVRVVSW